MFKETWKFTLPILLVMLAALGIGGYVVLKVNDFSYGTKIKVPGWLEFETQFIKGIEKQKSMTSDFLIVSSPTSSQAITPVLATNLNKHSKT